MDKLLELKAELKNKGVASYLDSAALKKNGKLHFRNRELIDLSSFDCLGLSQSKNVKRAAQESIELSGYGSASSRKNTGTRSEHLLAEKALASFFGYPQSLLFSSKNQAFFSLLATLLREQDQVVCDEDSAGVLSDICLLLNCNLEIVSLDEINSLDAILQQPFYGKRRFVIADTISQSNARKLDLAALSISCARNSAFLIIDESSAVSLVGDRGSGVLEELSSKSPALPKPLVLISELGLGLGCFGAVVCADSDLIEAIGINSKTLSVEPAPPASMASALRASCELSELKCLDRALLEAKRTNLAQKLAIIKPRLNIACSSFISIKLDKVSYGIELQNHLFSKGFWVDLVPSPSKFSQVCYVRVSPSLFHSDEVLQIFVDNLDSFFSKKRI